MTTAAAPSFRASAWDALLRLNAVSGIHTCAYLRLWHRLGEGFVRACDAELAQAGEFDLETASRVRREAAAFDPAAELERAQGLGVRLVARGDAEYPAALEETHDPPLVLYVMGNGRLDSTCRSRCLAVVGSRRATPYGLRMTRSLVREAAARKPVIVSGLARGIDAQAHLTALECGLPTWAVLGSGLGRIYPNENLELARRIADSGGCVVSEWPLDAAPLRGHFPRRNRIVAGLCWGTIVVEGDAHSGGLITARLALAEGREVFAVPGPADAPLSAAPHILLRQGAKLTCSMADVWADAPEETLSAEGLSLYKGETNREEPKAAKAPSLSSEQAKVLQCLGSETKTTDELVAALGIDFPRLSNIIFEMELRDLILAVPGQRYAKKGR